MAHHWDDDELLAELAEALRAADEVPPELIEMGDAIFAWKFTWSDADAELAALTYDSEFDAGRVGALTREESAPLRALTFACPELTFELEITQDAVLGQVIPYRVMDVRVRFLSGEEFVATTDEVGCFTLRPIPAAPFYLQCRTENGTAVATHWITL
ncbi:hypothetical protein J5X84_24130 [Streptosporangiaceae bacterium NEAU-GS5]|nr:hypothetical protein [Streptosporangiaceae bacterium NEAU-GS5]